MFENVDWAATGAFWSGVGSVIGGAALWATFYTARRSLKDWREQELFRENRKVAVEALAAFEEGKDAIAAIRGAASLGGEQAAVIDRIREAEKKEGISLTSEELEKHKKRLTVHLRIEHYADTWRKISELLPLVKAVFGERAKALLFEIFEVRHEIFVAAEMFRHDISVESAQKFNAIIWQITSDATKDPIISKLNEAGAELESILEPFIARPQSG